MSSSRGIGGKDAVLLLLLASLAALLHARVLFGGGVYFTNDLTHVSHPWRVLTAQQLQKGQVPLWNPYAYFGLPLLGTMQTGQFFPPSLLFQFFHFPRALGFYLFSTYSMGGLWSYLWLRRLGFGRWPTLAGSGVLVLGGFSQGFLQFPNLLGAALQLPAFFLFSGSSGLLALISAFAFLAGYPLFWAASVLCLLSSGWVWARRAPRPGMGSGIGGMALGLALSAMVLFPGLELAAQSNRRRPLPAAERLNNSMSVRELSSFISPRAASALARKAPGSPSGANKVRWVRGGLSEEFSAGPEADDPIRDASGVKVTPWKSCYIGGAAFLLSLAGLLALARRSPARAGFLLAAGGGFSFLLLGSTHPASAWLWEALWPLRFIRGPGRFTYLPLAGLLPLTALGVEAFRRAGRGFAPALALAVLAELVWTGWGDYPTLPGGYYAQAGEFVEFLRGRLGSGRYFLLPSGEAWALVNLDDASPEYREFREMAFNTYKQKLFGIANAVFHLPAGSGGYESMVPARNAALIQELRESDGGLLSFRLNWSGIRWWFDRDGRSPAGAFPFADRGLHLWRAFEAPPSAEPPFWLPRGAAIPSREALARAVPWTANRDREDRLRVLGRAPESGQLYLAEPDYPGWRLYVNGALREVRTAWSPFVAADVPSGWIRAVWSYRPLSWAAGLAVGLAAWSLLAGFAGVRLRRWQESL